MGSVMETLVVGTLTGCVSEHLGILQLSVRAPMREGQALVGRWGAWPSLVRSVMEAAWAEGPAKRAGHERDGEVPVRPFIPLPHAIRLRTDLGMW